MFDKYKEESVKASTHYNRRKRAEPIWRMVEGRYIPVPTNWQNFMALLQNKVDLSRLLSDELILQAPCDKSSSSSVRLIPRGRQSCKYTVKHGCGWTENIARRS